ncbi:MAG: sporulation protein [Lachnospiraceae bacterium]|nr:sporulation protein [Lachnospiraceae bacterium]
MKKRPLNYVSEHLNLPADIICGSCIATAYGNKHLYIENYRGILEYTENTIRILGKNGRIYVYGSKLTIKYYTDNDMRIDGFIHEIKFS